MIGRTAAPFLTPEDRADAQIDRKMLVSLASGRGLDERWHLEKDGSRL